MSAAGNMLRWWERRGREERGVVDFIGEHNLQIQWNPSNTDAIGPEESVLIREVSLLQRLKCTQALYRRESVSCLERCP